MARKKKKDDDDGGRSLFPGEKLDPEPADDTPLAPRFPEGPDPLKEPPDEDGQPAGA
jgi:hypothetical protein